MRFAIRTAMFAIALMPALAQAEPVFVPDGGSLPIGNVNNTDPRAQQQCTTGQAITSITVNGRDFVNQLRFHCDDILGGGYAGEGRGYTYPVGNTTAGGIDQIIHCAAPNFVIGVRGKVSSEGARVSGLRLLCGRGRGAGPASEFAGRERPHDAETLRDSAFSCGPGKAATGVFASVIASGHPGSGQINGFGFYCSAVKDVMGDAGGSPNTGASFVGNWTVDVGDGPPFPMTLYLSGGKIVGVYDQSARNGIVMNGTATATDLQFNWQTTGTIKGSGTGAFHLNTSTSMSGTWTMGLAHGSWSATKGSGLGSN